jgi:hypothetical protein
LTAFIIPPSRRNNKNIEKKEGLPPCCNILFDKKEKGKEKNRSSLMFHVSSLACFRLASPQAVLK